MLLTIAQRQSPVIALIISVVSSVLTLLSAHYTDHALGQPVMKTILVPTRLRQLNSYLGGSNNELIIVVMKLYNVISNFAGGNDRKAVLEGFGWEIKVRVEYSLKFWLTFPYTRLVSPKITEHAQEDSWRE